MAAWYHDDAPLVGGATLLLTVLARVHGARAAKTIGAGLGAVAPTALTSIRPVLTIPVVRAESILAGARRTVRIAMAAARQVNTDRDATAKERSCNENTAHRDTGDRECIASAPRSLGHLNIAGCTCCCGCCLCRGVRCLCCAWLCHGNPFVVAPRNRAPACRPQNADRAYETDKNDRQNRLVTYGQLFRARKGGCRGAAEQPR